MPDAGIGEAIAGITEATAGFLAADVGTTTCGMDKRL